MDAGAEEVAVRARPGRWERRWLKLHEKHLRSESENRRLRAAIDEINSDVEEFLNVAHQAGHEAAKSWMIRAQARTIRDLRSRLEGKTNVR